MKPAVAVLWIGKPEGEPDGVVQGMGGGAAR